MKRQTLLMQQLVTAQARTEAAMNTGVGVLENNAAVMNKGEAMSSGYDEKNFNRETKVVIIIIIIIIIIIMSLAVFLYS